MDEFGFMELLEQVNAAIAVVLPDGSALQNSRAKIMLGALPEAALPELLNDTVWLHQHGLYATISDSDAMTVYTLFHEEAAQSPEDDENSAMLKELRERDRRRELIVSICLVCAYSQGTLDGVYYAVSETARLLEADCAALFLADRDSRMWKSICLCTADGDNAGYSVRTDIPFDEFHVIEQRLDEKSCIILTGSPEAQLVSGEASAVCAARVSADDDTRAVLWLERRSAPENWAKAESAFIYILLGVLKMALRRSRMERELKDALREAHEASAAKSHFFSSMSHELRTPINAILGMVDLARNDEEFEISRSYCLNKIEEAGLRLLKLVTNLLDISSVEAGKFSITPSDFSLRQLLRSDCEMAEICASGKDIKIICEIDDSLPDMIRCDEAQLRRVVTNLLDNAVKYTERGFVRLTATCLNDALGDALSISVADTGIGIAPEDHQRIFSAYERLDSSSCTADGTGLGLQIVRSIVELMGGRIDVKSTLGKGSTFTVTLPLVAADEQSSAPEVTVFSAPRANVLTVDDSKVSLMVTCGMLKKYGIDCDTAPNGKEALALASVKKYDLIFMDHFMPVMSGEDACRAIRSAGVNIQTPIIAVTADATQTATQTLYSAGVSDVLTKPLFGSQLGAMLQKWLPDELIVSRAAPEASPFPATPVLDFAEALDRIGSRELLNEAFSLTLATLSESVQQQCSLLDCGDLTSLRTSVHGTKGALGMIGAKKAAELAQQLENAGMSGDADAARTVWDGYESALRELSTVLTQYLSDDNSTFSASGKE